MRVGILGFGGMGRHHAAAIKALDCDITVHSACDVRRERRQLAEREFAAKTYARTRRFLADPQLELVVVATPSARHCRDVIACLEAAKPALTEKPACRSTAEYDRMLAAMKRTGVFFTVAHNRRWDNDYRTICRLAEEGWLGEIVMIKTRVVGFHPLRGWRSTRRAGGGSLYDWGSHLIDQVVQLLGARPALVAADMRCMRRSKAYDADDFGHVFIRMDTGASAIVEVGGYWRAREPRFHVIGTKGTVICQSLGDAPRLWLEVKGRPAHIDVPLEPGDWDLSFREIYPNLAQVIAGQAQPLIQPRSVRPVMQILDAAFESARTGRAVHIRRTSQRCS